MKPDVAFWVISMGGLWIAIALGVLLLAGRLARVEGADRLRSGQERTETTIRP